MASDLKLILCKLVISIYKFYEYKYWYRRQYELIVCLSVHRLTTLLFGAPF